MLCPMEATRRLDPRDTLARALQRVVPSYITVRGAEMSVAREPDEVALLLRRSAETASGGGRRSRLRDHPGHAPSRQGPAGRGQNAG